MAEWLGTALQKLLQRFESASDLTKSALQVIVAHFFLLSVGSSKADQRPTNSTPPKKGEPPRGDPPPIPRKCGVCYAGYCLSTARPEGLPIFSYTFGNEQVMRIVDNRQHAEWELTNYAKVATQAQLSSKFVEIFL